MASGATLIGRIKETHRELTSAVSKGVEKALQLGALLQEARAQVPHGQWTAWVEHNFEFTIRTAQAYMSLAARLKRDPSKAQRVALLPLREALEFLAGR